MIKDVVALGRALSDPGRVRVLHALSSGEMCLCQLVELLGLATQAEERFTDAWQIYQENLTASME